MAIRINDLHSSSVHTEYAATYSNNVISLTNAGDNSPVFIFTAPVDYVSGTTFNVNGIETPATMIGGEPLPDGAFVTGDVLIVSRGVNGINFRLGGEGGKNYEIICNPTQPVSPKENTIWLRSSASPQSYVFSVSSVTALAGRSQIMLATSSSVELNFIKSKTVPLGPYNLPQEHIRGCLGAAYVCTKDGTWTRVDGYCYQNGQWIKFS